MEKALEAVVRATKNTKDAILMALKTPKGEQTVWVVVEAEDDCDVYSKFVDKNNTIVKTSVNEEGRKGYANVESIVNDIKQEVSTAHIIGIRDTDYSRYEEPKPNPQPNIFKTDHRDLEMMMLSSESVQTELNVWVSGFDKANKICVDICRYFGYLRIYNHIEQLSCTFHNNVEIKKCWNESTHSLKSDWKEECTTQFLSHISRHKTEDDLESFIKDKKLEDEDFFDICRGHDYLSILSKVLIHTNIYSPKTILIRMSESFSYNDFKQTQLYANIKKWQDEEKVTALAS